MDLLAFDLTGTLVGVIVKMRYCGLQQTMNWMFSRHAEPRNGKDSDAHR